MSSKETYSLYAILHELNKREFKKKLSRFPDEVRYYVSLASSIIGAENAKRVEETPRSIVENSKAFVYKLLRITNPGQDEVFKEILATHLVETLKDELRFCCPNCRNFHKCLEIEHLTLGQLFKKRTEGEDTEELVRELELQIENALHKTPHLDTDKAHALCKDFIHQYNVTDIGEIMGRYSNIALNLQNDFGIDYKKIQQKMVSINLEFCKNLTGQSSDVRSGNSDIQRAR